MGTAWDSIYSTRMIATHNLRFPNTIHEDALWFFCVWFSAERITYVNESLYIYRLCRQGSITDTVISSNQEYRVLLYLRNYTDCIEWIYSKNYLQQYRSYVDNFIIQALNQVKGATLSSQRHCVRLVKRYLPYTIYHQFKKEITKQHRKYYIKWIFSVTKDRISQEKICTLFGIRIRI